MDQNLSPRTTRFLREELGLNVTDVREVGLAGALDEAIYAFAVREGYILVTSDLDFARLYRQGRDLAGLILLRLGSPAIEAVHSILRDFFSRIELDRLEGAITVVRSGRYRIRRV